MFIIDKFNIEDTNDLYFNKNIYLNLIKNLKQYDDIYKLPNLLIYGLKGSGKSSFINMIIKNIYKIDKIILKKSVYKIIGYGNNTVDVDIYHSDYHIIIEPYNTGFDKYLIQEIIKKYIKSKMINLNRKNLYKIILINNIDKLSYYAQTSLRCTMEKYSNNCKFILSGSKISKVIDPIKSRCLYIRLSKPNFEQCKNIINNVKIKENLKISSDKITKIIKDSNCNTKTLIWHLDLVKNNINYVNEVDQKLIYIISIINNDKIKNSQKILLIRDELYLLFTTNIDFKSLLIKFINIIYSKISDDYILLNILEIFSNTDLNLSLGKRIVIHFENLIFNLLYIIKINNIIL